MPDKTPRNIVVFSDGTGNSSAKLFKTNVWRMYDAIDLSGTDQIALYDDGVGTASFAPLAVLGGGFGWGLKRNVRDLYMFLCRNYRPGDRIFAFGFSRGAFTVRVLAGLIESEGLIRGHDGRELMRLATWAYRRYRGRRNPTRGMMGVFRRARNGLLQFAEKLRGCRSYASLDGTSAKVKPRIEFLGVWDTVDAYGLPMDELTRGWDQWIWPLSMPDICTLPDCVDKACHAVALDDERNTFHPLLWDETGHQVNLGSTHTDEERLTQVWFAGVHSDVGGGYPDDGLAHAPLVWISREAQKRGLRFQSHLYDAPPAFPIPKIWPPRFSASAPLHDSRRGFGSYYRYNPRHIKRLTDDDFASIVVRRPKIHASVFDRLRDGTDAYAPIVLPDRYAAVMWDGAVKEGTGNPFESTTQAQARAREQESVWNLVWQRRIFYFLTVGVSLYLAAQPIMPDGMRVNSLDGGSPTAAGVIHLLGSFVPGFVSSWLVHYEKFPWQLITGGVAIWLLMSRGTTLQRTIRQRMREIWTPIVENPGATVVVPPGPGDPIFKLRTSSPYRHFFSFVARQFLPFVFGLTMLAVLVLASLLVLHRVTYEAAAVGGRACSGSKDASPLAGTRIVPLDPAIHCVASGVMLQKDHTYELSIAVPAVAPDDPPEGTYVPGRRTGVWMDGGYRVPTAAGFGSERARIFTWSLPLRRILLAPWYAPIARLGRWGADYRIIGATPTRFRASRDSELFLFVNDAVLPWPFWFRLYANNTGAPGQVTVRLVSGPSAEIGRP